jgi:membrane-associated protein
MENIFEWLKSLHNPETFVQWLVSGGVYIVSAIVFAETGLLIGFFLPGDSMLITTGVLSNPLNPNYVEGLVLSQFLIGLTIAAIVGDQLGYFLGNKTGHAVSMRPDGIIFKKKYLVRAHAFYDRYGIAALIACRFIPIMRTFVPFVAGMAEMPYRKFLAWDIVGGVVWINSLLIAGFYLGQSRFADRIDKIILIVIFVSILPMIVGGLRQILKSRKAEERV